MQGSPQAWEMGTVFLDLHVHSRRSDDAGATVEGYLKWIGVLRQDGYQVDGIVLTEHRGFDLETDYSAVAARYEVLVLKGSEIETDLGHLLVYGVTSKLLKQFDFSSLNLPAQEVLKAVRETGGYAVAAHPGRRRIGLWEHLQGGADIAGIRTIEMLNGGSSPQENALAVRLAQERGFSCVGGSDAHFVSSTGKYLTRLPMRIARVEELVEALSLGQVAPVALEETRASTGDPQGDRGKGSKQRTSPPSPSGASTLIDIIGDARAPGQNPVGSETDQGTHRVTAEEIVAYARALGESNPLFTDAEAAKAGPYGALIAPPFLFNTIAFQTGPEPLPPTGGGGTSSLVSAQRVEFLEPVRAGDTLSATSRLLSEYTKTGRAGRLVFSVRQIIYRNQENRKVMVVENSSVQRQMPR